MICGCLVRDRAGRAMCEVKADARRVRESVGGWAGAERAMCGAGGMAHRVRQSVGRRRGAA